MCKCHLIPTSQVSVQARLLNYVTNNEVDEAGSGSNFKQTYNIDSSANTHWDTQAPEALCSDIFYTLPSLFFIF